MLCCSSYDTLASANCFCMPGAGAGARGEQIMHGSRGPLGEKGVTCVEVESRGAVVQAEGARI
jgi:hypothetical protein